MTCSSSSNIPLLTTRPTEMSLVDQERSNDVFNSIVRPLQRNIGSRPTKLTAPARSVLKRCCKGVGRTKTVILISDHQFAVFTGNTTHQSSNNHFNDRNKMPGNPDQNLVKKLHSRRNRRSNSSWPCTKGAQINTTTQHNSTSNNIVNRSSSAKDESNEDDNGRGTTSCSEISDRRNDNKQERPSAHSEW